MTENRSARDGRSGDEGLGLRLPRRHEFGEFREQCCRVGIGAVDDRLGGNDTPRCVNVPSQAGASWTFVLDNLRCWAVGPELASFADGIVQNPLAQLRRVVRRSRPFVCAESGRDSRLRFRFIALVVFDVGDISASSLVLRDTFGLVVREFLRKANVICARVVEVASDIVCFHKLFYLLKHDYLVFKDLSGLFWSMDCGENRKATEGVCSSCQKDG